MGAIVSSARAVLGVVLQELVRPSSWAGAAIIGLALHLGLGMAWSQAWLTFGAPLVVLLGIRSASRYTDRHVSRLLSLPAEHESPAFVMDRTGAIVAAQGRTQASFADHSITHVNQLFGDDDGAYLVHKAAESRHSAEADNGLELFSQPLNAWFSVKYHAAPDGDALVWFDDVTDRHRLDERLSAIRVFTARSLYEIRRDVRRPDRDKIVAEPILSDGYGAVFVGRRQNTGGVSGRVYRLSGVLPTGRTLPGDKLVQSSDVIHMAGDDELSVRHSQQRQRVIMDCSSRYSGVGEFEVANRFHDDVRSFIGEPIHNFANYREGEIVVIAFNRPGHLRPVDRVAMEALVNTVHTVGSLMDLVSSNDERFMQAITGVCSASEYSDELTGQHIRRVNEYSRLVAQELGMSAERVEAIGQVAALHDIGKVAIPHIIKLERRLEPTELAEMQMHTIYGAQIIDEMIATGTQRNARLELGREIALHHHQRWDGRGYPGLLGPEGKPVELESRRLQDYQALQPPSGPQIPRSALIVSLADKYDALRSQRQYKPAYTHERTVAILSEDDRSGARGEDVFGPEIFGLFMRLHSRFAEIYAEHADS